MPVIRTHDMCFCVYLLHPESIEIFIEDQAFSMSYDLAPLPPHSPQSRQQVVSLSLYARVSPIELTWARIFKLLRSTRIDSKEPIPPGCVAGRAGTTTLFQLGS